jgi:glyoxylase-like metal-dependent hydrolase (beta-lactamase superfamily II)
MQERTSKNPWFRTYKVSDGIHSIVEPFHYEEPISFLIEGIERAVLLDTGMGLYDIRAEAESITSLPLAVVNTHWHYDHLGGNYQFSDVWAGDNDFEVEKIEAGMLSEDVAHSMTPEWVCASLPRDLDPATFHIRPCKVTRRLRHLEEIDLGGRNLIVHHTPGHSPGGICLYDTKDRILFTGDMYYPGALFANLERSNFEEFVVSLTYLNDMLGEVSFVCPAHNESKVPKEEITAAYVGFLKVRSGQAEYTTQGKAKVHRFGRFSVALPL